MQDFLIFTTAAEAEAKKSGKPVRKIVWTPDPYPRASLYLGSYFNEIGQPDRAILELNKGLALLPDEPHLLSEKGAALIAEHRWVDALAVYDRGIALTGLEDKDRARLYRGRGFCLTEQHLYDDAEVAYRESLKLAPGNQTAEAELKYIKGVRDGAAPTATQLQIPGGPPKQ
jgi:tetratricopeptide (TPR) repeat protein